MTLRSDPMAFCEIFIPPEAAFETMNKLGEMGCVQFLDLNEGIAPYLKNYIAEVCRCADMERKMRYIEAEITKDSMPLPDPDKIPPPLYPNDMLLYENLIEKWETDISELSQNQVNLMQDLLEMKEMRYVLNYIGPMLGSSEIGIESILSKQKGAGDVSGTGRLFVMTGVVRRMRSFPFEMMLWRISRGNIYYRQAELDEVLTDPYTGGDIRKVAFLAICQGESLSLRMEKVFSGFRVNTYPCPETADERMFMLHRIQDRICDLEDVLTKSKYYRCKTLRAVSKQWRLWMIQVRKSKAIYHSMNLFTLDITKNCLIGQCWLPERDLKRVQKALCKCAEMTETNVSSFLSKTQTDLVPPTHHRTNKFTYGFQMLIDAYGDSKYRELNPALFTVITFPFLFAVMFGDSGHAVIIISFALFMIIMEKEYMGKRGSEIWNIFFGGRYVMLFLGLFSFYTGIVYNEMFCKAINISGSMWRNTKNLAELSKEHVIQLGGSSRLRTPYVYGMDPIWQMSKNKIMMENSIKMKMSIIIGVTHMLFGILLSVFNHLYFKKYYSVILQFIPEFMFLLCIFFWLVIMVYYKWFTYYDGNPDSKLGSACAPQILILFIDMVLYGQTTKKEFPGCDTYLFSSQPEVQKILVTVALAMVPVLLFGSPIYVHLLNKRMRKKATTTFTTFRKYQLREPSDEDPKADARLKAEIAKYSAAFSDLMIHQAVHTIEFVLSTISHTASYLRLWALSLAHSQLSEMLWGMILSKLGLRDMTPLAHLKLFFAFGVWASFTVAILVVMEGLSSFLHTLRLHWVEFMSKFFIGGGYPFAPFCFHTILAVESDKPEGGCKSRAATDRAKQDH